MTAIAPARAAGRGSRVMKGFFTLSAVTSAAKTDDCARPTESTDAFVVLLGRDAPGRAAQNRG